MQRVREAVEATGYRPNSIGRTLRSGESRLVAMLVANLDNPAMATVAASTEAAQPGLPPVPEVALDLAPVESVLADADGAAALVVSLQADADGALASLASACPVPAEPTPTPEPTATPEPESKKKPVTADGRKVGRNDPCPCGSGKKYKNCCGKAE